MASKTIQLNGLKGNKKRGSLYKEGDVVYRKYGREWHIYISYTNPMGTQIRRAFNDVSFIASNPDLETALKKAAKPFSQINDKIDNRRSDISDIAIIYDDSNLTITGFKIGGAKEAVEAATEEQIAAKRVLYEAIPDFGVFLAKPS